MAEPTTRLRKIPNSTAATDLNTPAKRLGDISGQDVVSTGEGNEADFGTVDISVGAADSDVLTFLWDITADGGNTLVEDFKFWLSSEGFDQAGTLCKFAALSGADQGSPSLTQNYVENAIVSSYSWTTLPDSQPGSINLYPSDEGSSMALSTTSDDAILFAVYLAVADGETTGLYKDADAGYEFRFSFRYSYK